jgi:HD-GYP domain-containing protein (c-di-GMP phosphodiesterase class II)
MPEDVFKDELIQSLRRSNRELDRACNAMIEKFAHALDMREVEPPGHTHQLAEFTLRLARAMGVEEDQLDHIRRGALLHDIGKMGIPEQVLRKEEPLTDEEWRLVCLHPKFAYDLLAQIDYLVPALEIPHCHHERWDGSGYPSHLKEKQIPLAARIFSVVDVWDALTTNTFYRKAWPHEKAIQYIQEHAGTYFDPEVVKTFLSMDFKKQW